ncbi:hypothetical protein B0T10DRAFT_404344 [Thelonectria olida]|uniref:DUF3669 domain-containing protein n=1 Tax=Thelonectria olida TaxID=1576542 RepID=A0A9P8W3S4_9HYPO|nr:hypothetical protein B0T10DRAFT_404344 [Thelonectria olida]
MKDENTPSFDGKPGASLKQNNNALRKINFNNIGFRKIGFGQCGFVFERPGWEFVSKVSRPGFGDALWSDFYQHLKVWECFRDRSLDCRVPAVHGYVPQEDTAWWAEKLHNFPSTSGFQMPSNALLTKRILPLPKIVREALIDSYCPEDLIESAKLNHTNRDCLARIYLGRRTKSETKSPNFTLRNFNLHLDQMIELDLYVAGFSRAMGEALAIIHWDANVDGYDIEFVLGNDQPISKDVVNMPSHASLRINTASTPKSFRRKTSIWCLDFNLCSSWPEDIGWKIPEDLIEQLVIAFFENDSYYPLPLMETDLEEELWSGFRDAYLYTAKAVLATKDARLRALPALFIQAGIKRERWNLELGRDFGECFV